MKKLKNKKVRRFVVKYQRSLTNKAAKTVKKMETDLNAFAFFVFPSNMLYWSFQLCTNFKTFFFISSHFSLSSLNTASSKINKKEQIKIR